MVCIRLSTRSTPCVWATIRCTGTGGAPDPGRLSLAAYRMVCIRLSTRSTPCVWATIRCISMNSIRLCT